MNFQQLFQVFGYPLVALGIGLESMGVPAPGETILLIAAAASATGSGQIVWVILAAAAGAIIGDNIAFTLGQRYGRSLLTRIPFINEEKLTHSEAFFHKHGPKTVIIARFIPVVRSVVAYIAGINKMRHQTFTVYNLVGGLLWAVIIGSLGFIFGKNLHLVELWLQRIGGIWVAILLVGGLLLWVNHRWYQDERRFRLGRTGTAWTWWQEAWQRLTQQGQRGLLVYGFLLILSGWATGVLLDDWVEREPELYQRDRLVRSWLQLGAEEVSPWTEALAWLGDVRLLAVVTAVTTVFLWRRGRQRNSVLTVVMFAGALALGVGLQVWLKRPLPPSPELLWQLTPYAFPHLSSLLTVAVYGWLAHLWQQERPWSSRVNGATVAIFLSASVGITGLYLGQANLSDVLAGWSLGFLWLGIPLSASDRRVKQVREKVKAKAELMKPRQRLNLLLALTLPVLVLTFLEPPIAQDPSYHNFADQRLIWGVPNFFNVTSNAPFLIFGVMGLLFLWRLRRTGGWPAFVDLVERRPYLVFFIGVAVTSFGSAYYHLDPNNTHLVWDRLPMTFGFMSIFAAVIMERIDRDAGLRLLWPLVAMGIASVGYWYWSELHLQGDLRFYVDVQFYPLMAIPLLVALFPSRYTKGEQVYTIILIYALAKAFELLDKPVYQLLGGVISGHTIKHLVAALATYWAMRMLLLRRPLEPENSKAPERRKPFRHPKK